MGIRKRLGACIVALALIVVACGAPTSPTPSATASASPTASASATATPSGPVADVIFRDADVVTVDDAHPNAQAVAVKGDRIMAVGTNVEFAAFQGPGTAVVTLGGKTLVPGFADTHQHRIGDGPSRLGLEPKAIIDAAIEQGLTTIDELYVDQGRLDELRDLDVAGVLRLRVNAYLPVQQNSPEGALLGAYFDAYQQGQVISPHVRVAGLKVFTDFDNAKILLWKQADLNAFLLARHQKGWHLAVKTVSTKSLAMIVKAFQSIQATDPNVVDARGRLEHMLFATSDQIALIKALGLVPVVNLNYPGEGVGVPDIDYLVGSEPTGSYTPWRSLFEAGIPAAGMSGFPSGYVDEPTGAPWASPIHLIYQAVTRVGKLGQRSPQVLLDQAITAEGALRAVTIHAARAVWEDDVKGSITAGKLADLVVLSADPLTSSAEQINEIDVLMTMIGGKVEFCAPGSAALCPVPGSGSGPVETPSPAPTSAAGFSVTASASLPEGPPSNAIDRDRQTVWNSGSAPEQWIQIDLGAPRSLAAVRLVTSQSPSGATVHQVWVGDSQTNLRLAHEFKGQTQDFQELSYTPSAPATNVRFIRIVTTESPSWVAWREIEIVAL
jgi:predicted amidohydrolase YtcJ